MPCCLSACFKSTSNGTFDSPSLYTFNFVSEISTCSLVSLVQSCYLRKFDVSYFISECCVPIVIIENVSNLSQNFLAMQLYLLTMSLTPEAPTVFINQVVPFQHIESYRRTDFRYKVIS